MFRDMFTFPHPGPGDKHDDDDDYKDDLPIVRLPESSMTLSMLLYAIYPVSPSHAPPPYATQGRGEDNGALDTLTEAWLAADKYEVGGLRKALTARLQTHPLMARQPAASRTICARRSCCRPQRRARSRSRLCAAQGVRGRLCGGVPPRAARAGHICICSGKRRRCGGSAREQGLAVLVWESEGAVAEIGGAEREAQRTAGDICYGCHGCVCGRVEVVVDNIVRSLSVSRRVSAGSGAHVSGDAQGGNRRGGPIRTLYHPYGVFHVSEVITAWQALIYSMRQVQRYYCNCDWHPRRYIRNDADQVAQSCIHQSLGM